MVVSFTIQAIQLNTVILCPLVSEYHPSEGVFLLVLQQGLCLESVLPFFHSSLVSFHYPTMYSTALQLALSPVTFRISVGRFSLPLTLFAMQAVIVTRSRLLKPSKAPRCWVCGSISRLSSEHCPPRANPAPPEVADPKQTNYFV